MSVSGFRRQTCWCRQRDVKPGAPSEAGPSPGLLIERCRSTLGGIRHPLSIMNIKRLWGMSVAIQFFPLLAHAQAPASSGEGSIWGTLFWTILPIVIAFLVLILVIRKTQRPMVKRSQQYMERGVQHMERVEQSLERIIKAIEKKD